MPAATSAPPSLVLITGQDEYAVKQRARLLYDEWRALAGGMDHDIIDAAVTNAAEALKAISALNLSLQTLPFFGESKVIWFKNCNFLGEERTATAQAVTDALNDFAATLKGFSWHGVRLLVSAEKIDKRKSFYKILEKLAVVENLNGWSVEDKDWAEQAEVCAGRALAGLRKSIDDDSMRLLVAMAGAEPRTLLNEIEKLALYTGDRGEIRREDVQAIVTKSKQARAFALGDAVGDRDLPRALRCLDEEIWAMRLDRQKSEIGLLYGLISKMRALIFLREMLHAGWVRADSDYNQFKAQLGQVPPEAVPEDKRYNPLSQNPYVLYKALGQARRYSTPELVLAMQRLLECNQDLISSKLDPALVLQRALVLIIGQAPSAPAKSR